MNKKYKLKQKEIFQKTFDKGRNDKYNNFFFVKILKFKTNKNAKIGIAVSKKIGNAPKRNYIKRQVRAIFGNLDLSKLDNNNYVFVLNKVFCEKTFKEKKDILNSYYNKLLDGKKN